MADLNEVVLRRQIMDLANRVANLEIQIYGAARTPAQATPVPEARPEALAPSEPARSSLGRESPSTAPRAASASSFDVERFIGGKTFAVLGAAAVVVAAGLFLKLAYDQGWLGRVSDQWKCIFSAMFGVALLATGEGVLRRWGRWASMGLTSAGLGVVYASAFASYGFFELVGAPVAFAMLASVSALGIALSARERRVPVAILSTLAGYAIPILLYNASGPVHVLPTHLLALLLVSLVLCARLGRSFVPVRVVAWWCTLLMGTVWTLIHHDGEPVVVLAFLGAFWALVHTELLWSARRDDLVDAHGMTWAGVARLPVAALGRPDVRAMLASFTLTSWCATLGALTMNHGASLPEWGATGALCAATGLLWVTCAGGLRVLRDRPRSRIEAVGVALAMQSGALLVVTLSLALTGITESIAGLALGVAAVGAGRWMGLRAFRNYGLAVLALATARLLAVDFANALELPFIASVRPSDTVSLGELPLTRWMLVALLGAFAWLVSAALQRRSSGALASVCVVVGAGLITLSAASAESTARELFAVWTALPIVFALALRPFGRMLASSIALGVIPLAWGAWFAAWPALDWNPDEARAFLHHGFLASGALLATMLSVRALTPRGGPDSPSRTLRQILGAGAVLLVFVSSSAEVARVASIVFEDRTANYATLTVWWALFATTMIVAGFVRTIPVVRHVGLGLLFVAASKAVLFDLAEVEPAWRIASFLGVGLFMLGVATGYTRIARTAREPSPLEEQGASVG